MGMKKICIASIMLCLSFIGNSQTTIFNDVLQKHVSKQGEVAYTKLNEAKLKKYLNYLEKTTPDKSWSENKQKAFWINVYNAYTLKIILDNYPLKSIRDIHKEGSTAWETPLARVGGKRYTLNNIEHTLLRKNLFDPRIHVGVNCASVSCPKLSNIAFTEANIDRELERLMKEFINDSSKNNFTKDSIQISPIFNWFEQDFTKNGGIITFLNRYLETKIHPKEKISYLKYNWTLNGK
tara:strand:+ start:21655 stop:22365 length:711 start_codon:yes stop_codon:yes gene_type:complete